MDFGFAEGLIAVVSMVTGAGGAFAAARTGIKVTDQKVEGVKAQVLALETDLALHDERTRQVGERLAKIETLLQSIDKRLERRDI